MLARSFPRLAMCEDLLRQLAIGLGGHAVRVVLEHRHALHGRLAKRIVFLMRDAKTRSPKFSSRISIASLAWSVRESTSVGRMPSMSTSGSGSP
jgi:hypothetical protein